MSNRIAVMLISMIAAAVLLAVPAPSDAKLLMWKLDGVSLVVTVDDGAQTGCHI